MNIIDVLLILIILLAAYSGYHKGFIFGSLSLASLLVAIILTFGLFPYVASFLDRYTPIVGVWSQPFAFILTYIILRVSIRAIINSLIRRVHPDTHEEPSNKMLGVIPGAVNGGIYALIISAILLATPLFDGLSAKTRNSRIASELTPAAEWMQNQLSPVFDEAVNRGLNQMTVQPESDEVVNLSFTVNDPRIREDLETKMLQMVNDERQKHGLNTLTADPEMAEVARAHSKDMFARGYFAHTNPDGQSPFDRMKAGGVRYLTAGENLALAQTLAIAHKGLMNSPGHRANILQPAFGRLGVGILDGGRYGIMVTQKFRN